VFSGGATVLLSGSFVFNILTQNKNLKQIMKIVAGVVLFFMVFELLSYKVFGQDMIMYSYSYVERYYNKRAAGKVEAIIQSNNKLDRLLGPAYVAHQLSVYKKQLFGFGNDVYATSDALDIQKNKFNIGEITNLVPELMIKYGYLGLLVNVIFYSWLFIFYYKRKNMNLFFQLSFILVFITLGDFMYSKPIYQQIYVTFIFFFFYKAELFSRYNKEGPKLQNGKASVA